MSNRALCWFRRDLRLSDHAALYYALKNHPAVHCVFVFDTDLLDKLKNKQDRRVEFIWHSLNELNLRLQEQGSTLHVLHGKPQEVIANFAQELNVSAVYCNRDDEPDAVMRDTGVEQKLAQAGIAFHSSKDQVIFERSEIMTGSGTPYHVFTPYKNNWLKMLDEYHLRAYPVERYFSSLAALPPRALPALDTLGFASNTFDTKAMPAGETGAACLLADFMTRIDLYTEARNYPAIKGVSYLSTHLRFGTISIRHMASSAYHAAGHGAQTWLSELIWRDFYQMLLHHHPELARGVAFKPKFNAIAFENSEEKFAAWCEARTGYPLIDAAMRQLRQSGYMHNRLRMISASFLVKDLHIDWRRGEQFFAEHLLDFDLAANNGGWQWSASTGCDAQPWFRIFNPVTQSEKFDKEGKFIRRYLPELARCPDKWIHAPWLMPATEQQRCEILIGQTYPAPVVDHATARIKTLALYEAASH